MIEESASNKEGKWNSNGDVFKLVGYFDCFDIRVIERDSWFYVGSISCHINRAVFASDGIYGHSKKMAATLLQFGIDPINSITHPAGRYVFVFERTSRVDSTSIDKISLFGDDFTCKAPSRAIEEYLKHHDFVPLLTDQEDFHRILTRLLKPKQSKMTASFFRDNVKTRFGTGGLSLSSRELNEIREEEESSELNKTAKELKKQRLGYQKLALRKGGHVEITFGGHSYLVPKLPLLALRADYPIGDEGFTYEIFTWFFEGSPGVFRNQVSRDLLMGSDMPESLILSAQDDIISALKN